MDVEGLVNGRFLVLSREFRTGLFMEKRIVVDVKMAQKIIQLALSVWIIIADLAPAVLSQGATASGAGLVCQSWEAGLIMLIISVMLMIAG